MDDSSPPAKPPSGPLMPLPRDPKRVLELVVVLLLTALGVTQFELNVPTLVAILVVGLILLLIAAWPSP